MWLPVLHMHHARRYDTVTSPVWNAITISLWGILLSHFFEHCAEVSLMGDCCCCLSAEKRFYDGGLYQRGRDALGSCEALVPPLMFSYMLLCATHTNTSCIAVHCYKYYIVLSLLCKFFYSWNFLPCAPVKEEYKKQHHVHKVFQCGLKSFILCKTESKRVYRNSTNTATHAMTVFCIIKMQEFVH